MTLTLPRLIIFDLDGTLIDSAGDVHSAVNRMLRHNGRPPLSLAEVKTMIGDGAAKLIERALAARPGAPVELADAVGQFLGFYEAHATVFTTVYPDVPETLARLGTMGIPLAICTNKPERPTAQVLEALGLAQYFAHVVGGDTMPWRKPDPRVLTSLIEARGLPVSETLMVGDSEVDAGTAHAAGVPFVLMTYGYHRGPVQDIPSAMMRDDFGGLLDYLTVPA